MSDFTKKWNGSTLEQALVQDAWPYTLNSSWLLHFEIFYLEPCPKSPQSSGWLWTHQHMVFQSNTASRIQNYIVCNYYGHDINVWPKQPHLLLNMLMGNLIVLSPPILESLTTSKLTDFSVFQKNTWKTYYTTKL